jgi:hypothetical protein
MDGADARIGHDRFAHRQLRRENQLLETLLISGKLKVTLFLKARWRSASARAALNSSVYTPAALARLWRKAKRCASSTAAPI